MTETASAVRVAAFYATEDERSALLSAMKKAGSADTVEYSGAIEATVNVDQIHDLGHRFLLDIITAGAPLDSLQGPLTSRKAGQRASEAPLAIGLAPHRASELVAELPEHHRARQVLASFRRQAGRMSFEPAGSRLRARTALAGPAAHAVQLTYFAGPAAEAAQLSNLDMYYVLFRRRLSLNMKGQLTELGVQLLSHQPDGTYRALVPNGRLDQLRQLPFAASVQHPDLSDYISADFLQELVHAHRHSSKQTVKTFDVTAHRREDVPTVQQALESQPQVDLVSKGGSTIRFRAPIRAGFLAALVAMPEVASLTLVRRARLYTDFARSLVGADAVQTLPEAWTGHGEIVGIIDSGIDRTHPDLVGQVTWAGSLVSTEPDDKFGHGTHVAGIVAGIGAASGGKLRGIAPGAQLAVLKITNGPSLTMPPALEDWLQPVYDQGARVINVSLGYPPRPNSAYDHFAQSTDEFVYAHPDALVLVAAGNSGIAPDGNCAFNTLSSPGTAKNVVTVGATLTSRDEPHLTWIERSPAIFNRPPVSLLPVTGDPDLAAPNSGRGPASYFMVKPDLVAPGTYILSARAAEINARLPWLDCSDYDHRYVYIGGSSMATPIVAGAGAVVRQYLRTALGVAQPSSAVLKAVLIAGALRLPSTRLGSASDVGYPDYDQGFGRLDISSLLPTPGAAQHRRLQCVDVGNNASDALEYGTPPGSPHRAVRQFVATVAPSAREPLRIVLAWTDPPASGVQNHLGLRVLPPGGVRIPGNSEFKSPEAAFSNPDPYGIYWDRVNCVERIIIENPAAGEHMIHVLALDTPLGPQGFGLAVCGEITDWREV